MQLETLNLPIGESRELFRDVDVKMRADNSIEFVGANGATLRVISDFPLRLLWKPEA